MTLQFRIVGNLERVLEELPFPVQRIQTDRGREFFALAVQKPLMDYAIKIPSGKARFSHPNEYLLGR